MQEDPSAVPARKPIYLGAIISTEDKRGQRAFVLYNVRWPYPYERRPANSSQVLPDYKRKRHRGPDRPW